MVDDIDISSTQKSVTETSFFSKEDGSNRKSTGIGKRGAIRLTWKLKGKYSFGWGRKEKQI
jgi:hypothetical protein